MESNKIILQQKSYAKINLILKVFNKRPDNYHNIFTLMHKISLCDTIAILPPNKENISVECNVDLGIPQEDNIVYKAAMALMDYANCKRTARLKITKRIPTGAGLGGGSSNAATTLLMLNRFWDLNLSMNSLRKIAITLGSDVPFFLENYPKWVYGKGDHCQILNLIKKDKGNIEYKHINKYVIIVYSKIHIDTASAYQKFNRIVEDVEINEDTYFDKIMEYENILAHKHTPIRSSFFTKCMINHFERIIFKEHPEIKNIHKYLSELSNGRARLTGSGSAVFCLSGNYWKTKDRLMQLKQKYAEEGKDYLVFSAKLVV